MGRQLRARALLFDMDGTLVDSTAVVEAVWRDFSSRYGLDPAEVLGFAHGRPTAVTVRRFAPAEVDVAAVTAELDARELEDVVGVVAVPGAQGLLEALAGAPLAVVTSASRELARRRMSAAGISPPEALVSAEDVVEGKPAPEGYLRAAALLGADPTDCVAFEDAEAGLLAARASGASVVVVGGHVSQASAGLPGIDDFVEVGAAQRDGWIHLSLP